MKKLLLVFTALILALSIALVFCDKFFAGDSEGDESENENGSDKDNDNEDNSNQGGTDEGGTDEGGTDEGGTDEGGTDEGGTDEGGTDEGGTDEGGTDEGGTDEGGTDEGGTDEGGTDEGGTDEGGTDEGGTDEGGTDEGGTDEGEKSYTVIFDLGYDEKRIEQLSLGQKIEKPEIPNRAEYEFLFWEYDDNGTNKAWDFDTMTVTGDMTLVAKWNKIENLIYNVSTPVGIVIGEGIDADKVNKIVAALTELGVSCTLVSEESEAVGHEIVIGKTEREITGVALSRLERVETESDDEIRYLVYSNGYSVAVVFDDSYKGIAEDTALSYFYDNCVKESLVCESGVFYQDVIDTADCLTEIDEAAREAAWNALEEKYGRELTYAMRSLNSLCSGESLALWVINLYDPCICICRDLYGESECSGTKYCGGGGFYFSNSGRDNFGYLSDIESTYYAINLLSSVSDSGYSVLTDDMRVRIGYFVQSLQEENGYFYHPQWGKGYTDTHLIRRARDLYYANAILAELGLQPVYNTPDGVRGSGKPLLKPLNSSATASFSEVTAVSDIYQAHLQDLDSFMAYLETLDIKNNSYAVGNTLSSQIGQIKARDKQIGTINNPTPLMDFLIDWLNSNQNPETGHWDWKTSGDVYYSTNGLSKILVIYNAHGVAVPYTKEAVNHIMSGLTSTKEPSSPSDVYNSWVVIDEIIKNLKDHGGEEGSDEADSIIENLRLNASEYIISTRDKLAVFLKPDGSASYYKYNSLSTSLGCPVALPATVEGDILGTTYVIDTYKTAFRILCSEEEIVSHIGEYEKYVFRKTAEEIGPVIKQIAYESLWIDFEFDNVGDETIDFTTQNVSTVVRGDDENKYLEVCAQELSRAGAVFAATHSPVYLSSIIYVFEADLCLDGFADSDVYRLILDGAYMIEMRCEGGVISFIDSSSKNSQNALTSDLEITATEGEWFNIRVAYQADANANIEICLDGGEAVISDNYYDQNGDKLVGEGSPQKGFKKVSLEIGKNNEGVMLIDNFFIYFE